MGESQPFESLLKKQQRFAQMVATLLSQASNMGYEVSLGEAWRPPEMAQWYAQHGKGIKNSLHTIRLAVDLNLYHGDVLLRDTEDHRPLGVWWESQGGTWGGRFGDGNHYSLTHNGVK